jgi:hypothetical protein
MRVNHPASHRLDARLLFLIPALAWLASFLPRMQITGLTAGRPSNQPSGEAPVIPQNELDQLTLVINQAEFVTQEGYPELGYTVLQQGYQRVRTVGPNRELDALWKRALADHRERFPFVEPTAVAGGASFAEPPTTRPRMVWETAPQL